MTTPACQLYLVMPAGVPQAAEKLGQMLAGGHIACLLLTPDAEGYFEPAKARPLVKLAQARGVAVLVLDDAGLAKTIGADGVHLAADPFDYEAARRTLGPKAIVGVEVGLSRHDAMELGERGADYVAFAETGEELEEEDQEDEEIGVGIALPDRIAWWAEVFTVPCVAWDAIMPEEAFTYAEFGADFVALAPEAWLEAAEPARIVDAYAEWVGKGLAQRAKGDGTEAGG